jgi:ATP synthase protein I
MTDKDKKERKASGPPPLEPLTGPARREARRMRRAKGEKASFYRSLALLGTIGWLIVGPMLVGTFAGRWLDHRFDHGVTWTLGGAFAGLALGGWMAWRRLVESEEEEIREEAMQDSDDEEEGQK